MQNSLKGCVNSKLNRPKRSASRPVTSTTLLHKQTLNFLSYWNMRMHESCVLLKVASQRRASKRKLAPHALYRLEKLVVYR